jgi:hypothetical protein
VGQTEVSRRCYGLMCKNGEWIIIDFACAKSHHVGILHNLTDMCRKLSAFISLCMDRVPVAYHRVLCFDYDSDWWWCTEGRGNSEDGWDTGLCNGAD